MAGEPVTGPAALLLARTATGFAMAGVPASGSDAADADAAAPGALVHTADERAFARAVADAERMGPARWVCDGPDLPAMLLRHGVRIERCHDVGLVGRILATRGDAAELALTGGAEALLRQSAVAPGAPPPRADAVSLFDVDALSAREVAPERDAATERDPVPEPDASAALPPELTRLAERYRHQLAVIDGARDGGALRLLAAAESAGRLIATELGAMGVPFDVERHDRILVEHLGERLPGGRPAKLEAAAARVRDALGAPRLNVDSPRELLAALRAAGIDVRSTSQWELAEHPHPAVEPLLHYKKLARLFTANGWGWAGSWVRGGRLRTEYVPGGVVTGRWATSGGGALQLPRDVRGAVAADAGWKLVVADAAQLEPRILAALSGDAAMAAAGQSRDLYQAFVDRGVVPTRQDAKIGLLGAMYGGTQGRSGELLPSLARAFPRALALVEGAARAGERGEQVSTHLGRFSPFPPAGSGPDAGGEQSGARGATRAWGRFTRNFVVQGTAAEWALAWLARIRLRIARLDAPLASAPHLVYFLHDEVVVHAPAEVADVVAREVEDAAAWAGRLLFPGAPVAFPVTAAVVDSYSEAK